MHNATQMNLFARMEAFSKYAKFIAEKFSVKVSFEQNRASAAKDVIHLPQLAALTDVEVDYLYSAVLHEAGHLKHSDMSASALGMLKTQHQSILAFALEDARMENKLLKEFDGAGEILGRMYGQYVMDEALRQRTFAISKDKKDQKIQVLGFYLHQQMFKGPHEASLQDIAGVSLAQEVLQKVKKTGIDTLIQSRSIHSWSEVVQLAQDVLARWLEGSTDRSEAIIIQKQEAVLNQVDKVLTQDLQLSLESNYKAYEELKEAWSQKKAEATEKRKLTAPMENKLKQSISQSRKRFDKLHGAQQAHSEQQCAEYDRQTAQMKLDELAQKRQMREGVHQARDEKRGEQAQHMQERLQDKMQRLNDRMEQGQKREEAKSARELEKLEELKNNIEKMKEQLNQLLGQLKEKQDKQKQSEQSLHEKIQKQEAKLQEAMTKESNASEQKKEAAHEKTQQAQEQLNQLQAQMQDRLEAAQSQEDRLNEKMEQLQNRINEAMNALQQGEQKVQSGQDSDASGPSKTDVMQDQLQSLQEQLSERQQSQQQRAQASEQRKMESNAVMSRQESKAMQKMQQALQERAEAQRDLQEAMKDLSGMAMEQVIQEHAQVSSQLHEESSQLQQLTAQYKGDDDALKSMQSQMREQKQQMNEKAMQALMDMQAHCEANGLPGVLPSFESNKGWESSDAEQQKFDQTAREETGGWVANGVGLGSGNRDMLLYIDKAAKKMKEVDVTEIFKMDAKLSKLDAFNDGNEGEQTDDENNENRNVFISKRAHLPATKAFDTTRRLTMGTHFKEVIAARNKTKEATAKLKNVFRNKLKMSKKDHFKGGQEEGQLDARSIWKLAARMDDNFYEVNRKKPENKSVASILIDVSGSMDKEWTERGEKLKSLALMLSDALSDCHVKHEISGYHAPVCHEMRESRPSDLYNRRSNRLESIIYKGFTDMSVYGVGNLEIQPSDNSDGESLMLAYGRLKKERAKRRIMFVITDGKPFLSDANIAMMDEDLRRSIEVAQMDGMEIFALGFNEKPAEFYLDRYCQIKEWSDVPTFFNKILDSDGQVKTPRRK